MIFEANIILAGFTSKKVEDRRIISSVFLLDIVKNKQLVIPVSDNFSKDSIELSQYYRKNIDALIDIQSDYKKKKRSYVNVRFIGIKK